MFPTNFEIVDHPSRPSLNAFSPIFPTNSLTVFHPSLASLNALSPISPTNSLRVDHPFLIRDIPISTAFLDFSNPFLIRFIISFANFEKLKLLILLLIPSIIPRNIFFPKGCISLDGEWIPNAFLNPSINGLNMLFLIHIPIFPSALMMPRKSPFIMSPPATSIQPLK